MTTAGFAEQQPLQILKQSASHGVKYPEPSQSIIDFIMEITLNGEPREIPDDFTAAQLVEILDLTGKRMAMEINQEIVPRSTFGGHIIRPGDNIEIVGAIGGG